MTAERVTVSLPPHLLGDARAAVASGAAESLSAFVAAALRTQLARARARGPGGRRRAPVAVRQAGSIHTGE